MVILQSKLDAELSFEEFYALRLLHNMASGEKIQRSASQRLYSVKLDRELTFEKFCLVDELFVDFFSDCDELGDRVSVSHD